MFVARVTRQRAFAATVPPQQCIPRKQVFHFPQGQIRAVTKRNAPKHGPRYRTFEGSKSDGEQGQKSGPRGNRPQDFLSDRWNFLKGLWLTSPAFRYGTGAVGLGGGVFYISNLETVPVSGRKRFNVYSPESIRSMSKGYYEILLRQYRDQLLPPWHPDSKLAQRVLNRLIPHSGLQNEDWQIHVVDDPEERNAFVLPGGKVFVFSGLLDICNGEDGLAAVLGHEIAHNLANHMGERESSMIIAVAGVWLLSLLLSLDPGWMNWIFQFGYTMPGSRRQESEADYLGLLIMAESCYDPESAVELWKRMEKAEGRGPPQFLSTHPSHRNRVGRIQEWLPEARKKREISDCGAMLGYVNDFRAIKQGKGAWGDVW